MGWNDLIGRRIGPYEIIEELGRGGTARVYRAYQESPQRDVAIKVLLNDAEDRMGFVRRFERELEAVAQLNHPNIVAVFEAGELEDLVYLVMQCVNGGTFRQRLGQPLPVAEACTAVIQVARALQHAHARGIIHRDVKPSNMLIDSDNDGRILLTDFGIAKLSGMRGLTKSGTTIGTPEYMAPEQAEGREIDARADVYSLGCVLYEALAGHAPFVGASPVSVLYQQVHIKPDYIRVHNPDVPRELARIVEMALAKQPEQRFTSADSFAWALHPFTIARDHGMFSVPLVGRSAQTDDPAGGLDLRTGPRTDGVGAPAGVSWPGAIDRSAPSAGFGAEGLDALFPDDPEAQAARAESSLSTGGPALAPQLSYLSGASLVSALPAPVHPEDVLAADMLVLNALSPRPTIPLGALDPMPHGANTQSFDLPLTPEGQLDMSALMAQVEVAPIEEEAAQEWERPPDLPPYEQWGSSEEVPPYTAWTPPAPATGYEGWEDLSDYPPYMPYEPELGEVPSLWGDVHKPAAVATLDPITPPPIWRPEEIEMPILSPRRRPPFLRDPRALAGFAAAVVLALALVSWAAVGIARGVPRSSPSSAKPRPTATALPTPTATIATTPTPTQQQVLDRQAAADLKGAAVAPYQVDACTGPSSTTTFARSDAIWVSVCFKTTSPAGQLSVTLRQGSVVVVTLANTSAQPGHSYSWAYYASNLAAGSYDVVVTFDGGTGVSLPITVQ